MSSDDSVLTKNDYCQLQLLPVWFRTMNDLRTDLRGAVRAYIARTGMAPARLGAEAMGDPSFVHRLMRGRVPRLDTADKVLAYLSEQPIGPVFRAEIEAFIEITGTKPYLLGLGAAGDPSFVARIRAGLSPSLKTVQRVRDWMAAQCGAAERAAICKAVSGKAAGEMRIDITDKQEGGTSVNNTATEYLGTREAAAFLRLSPRTLDRYRVTGEGPAFHKFGARILYARDDLQSWAAARRMTSTSDDRAARRRAVAVRTLAAVAVAGIVLIFGADPALATTDTTFQGPLDTVTGMVGGTGGQLAAALAVGAALVGSVMRFNTQQLLGAVGVGVAAGAGVGIVTGLVGTAIV